MPDQRLLTADDFEKQQYGPQSRDIWITKQQLLNPLGSFDIELSEQPDEALLERANELAAFISAEYDAILSKIYEHYLEAAEDKSWMKGCGVPSRLREDKLMRYVRRPTISVCRDRNGAISGTIYFRPQWDEEHGIHLCIIGGHLVPQRL